MRCLFWIAVVALLGAGCFAHAREQEAKAGKRKARHHAAIVHAIAPLLRAVAVPKIDDETAQQLLLQYRPLLTAELELLRQTCDLAPEQRPKIKAAAEASVKQIVLHGGKVPEMNGFVDADAGSTLVRASLRKALAEALSPEQAASYARRLEKRTVRRKRAAIQLTVARLDAVLYLTPEQRDKISNGLTGSWQESWEGWLSMMDMPGNCLPDAPDNCIVPHLSAEQAAVFGGMEKVNFSIDVFDANQGVQETEDADWWNGKPAKAPEAAPGQPSP